MLLAALLAILEPAVGIPINVVSGFLPGTATRHRLLWTVAAAGFIVVIVGVVLWLRRLDERAARPVLAGQVPSVEGRASRHHARSDIAACPGEQLKHHAFSFRNGRPAPRSRRILAVCG